MRARRIAAATLVLVTLVAPADAQPPSGRRPELTTLLGREVFARPDDDGAIAKADAALAAEPQNLDLILAAARARDVALQFHAAIEVYTRGLAIAPADVRLLGFRGHRYISVRQFGRAVADLQRAVALAPSSFDVTYHLALAHYMRGEFDAAAKVYRSCLDATTPAPLPPGWRSCTTTRTAANDRVAVTDWLYRTLRRDGRHEEARALLGPFVAGMTVGENEAYDTALRFYKGDVTESQALTPPTANDNRLVTIGYGIAVHYGANGDGERACELLQRIANEPRLRGDRRRSRPGPRARPLPLVSRNRDSQHNSRARAVMHRRSNAGGTFTPGCQPRPRT